MLSKKSGGGGIRTCDQREGQEGCSTSFRSRLDDQDSGSNCIY